MVTTEFSARALARVILKQSAFIAVLGLNFTMSALAQNPSTDILSAEGVAAERSPLSAIDWLSESLTSNRSVPFFTPETDVSQGIVTRQIAVTRLDEQPATAVGLLPTAITGLPADLWGVTHAQTVAERLEGHRPGRAASSRRAICGYR